ncbi:MAG: M18 family aminopeptidase [Deltaproteobacteria bacterium]|nr:M18 family aminopeptidase [Deltaproteobacteria bacterium]
MSQPPAESRDLLSFIDASPSPFHATAEALRRCEAAGFTHLDEAEAWKLAPGGAYVITRGDGALLALRVGTRPPEEVGVRLTGAHTDSPNLRPKPRLAKSGGKQLLLDVEVYGGAIVATWADRDLGLAGRVTVEDAGRLDRRLVRLASPASRVSTLAIHLGREVNESGLKLDKHDHLVPHLGPWESKDDPEVFLRQLLADALKVKPEQIRGHDLCLFDLSPSAFIGLDQAMIAAPRQDNLSMCHATLTALLAAPAEHASTRVAVLFDHEEIGSQTHRGAGSPMIESVFTRLCGGDAERRARTIARSFLISADMAHALHPAHPGKHDGRHQPLLGGGPCLKTNANQRYATDAESGAIFRRLCGAAGVPCQEFAMRADLPCGSTIGPISAARLGLRTVDVGNPLLSMHSIRELGGSADHPQMIAALKTYFEIDALE